MRKSFAFILALAVFMGIAGQAGARKAGGTPPEVKKQNTATTSGATFTPNKQRFDPYKNYKFR